MKAGWQKKRLADFAVAVSTGPFGSILHKSDYVDDGVPLINPTNIVGEIIVPDPSKLISDVTIKRLSNYVLEAGDIVVGRRGEIGRCAVIGINESGWVCGTGSFFIRPLPILDSQFLARLIRSPKYQEQLESVSTGATMKNLSNSALGDLVISVPPLPEQHRIVAILDEAFEAIATAKANAEKNLQNARAVFESYLETVFNERGPGWVEKSLESIAYVLNGYSFKSEDFSAKVGAKCIKITNVGVREFVANSEGYLPFSFAEGYEKVSVKEGNIVLALTRTIIAAGLKVAIVPDEYHGALLNQRVASIKTNEEVLNGSFLFAYLSTRRVVNYVKERVNTLLQPNLSISDLRSIPIPVPPRREQNKITEQLDSIQKQTQTLTQIYQRKLSALDELKKSLLHQAFSGAL